MYVTFDFTWGGGLEMALFKIEEFSFKYSDQTRDVLKQIDLEIEEGSFVTICGKSGCGKTTLLRQLKPILSPYGHSEGRILFKGEPINQLDQRTQVMKLGYVLQNPEQQIVTDKVWHELAFGLESLGYDTQTIRLRVAEMASFFGITHWFYRSVHELSGGQKQLLNLAAVMAMQPEVILLDEPTAQLDPIAAKNFIEMLRRIHTELGITIILSEHRLEDVLPLTDKLVVMEQGKILASGSVEKVGTGLAQSAHELFRAMPTAFKVAWEVEHGKQNHVITVGEGRHWLREWKIRNQAMPHEAVNVKANLSEMPETRGEGSRKNEFKENKIKENEAINLLQLKEVYFRYEKNFEDTLKAVSYTFHKGRIHAIVGGNGTGKTTTLTVIAGLNKPYRGKVLWKEKVSRVMMLPQNPTDLFELPTVREELTEMLFDTRSKRKEPSKSKGLARVNEIKESLLESHNKERNKSDETLLKKLISELELEALLDMHPYDLSGGQMQSVALAKILLLRPEVLLLDEPTKGLDEPFKMKLGKLFRKLASDGITIIMVSHDLDFCAEYSDECALFFDGSVISSGETKHFFLGNSFYTTAANRMSTGIIEGCVTSEEVTRACLGIDSIND